MPVTFASRLLPATEWQICRRHLSHEHQLLLLAQCRHVVTKAVIQTSMSCLFYICPLSLQSDMLLTHLLLAPQDAGTIQVLPVYLQRGYSTDVQLEALHAMYNMCKISPTRQEAAALAGVVPLLVKLAVSPPSESGEAPSTASQPPAQMPGSSAATSNGEEVATVSGRGPYPLRPLAVSLLCGMAHSTHRTRHELWAHNVVALLLDLLKEEVILSNSPSSCCVQFGPDSKCDLQTGFTFVVVTGSYAVKHTYRLSYSIPACITQVTHAQACSSCLLFPLLAPLLPHTSQVVQVRGPPPISACV